MALQSLLALDGRVTMAASVFGVLIVLGGLLYISARGELKGKRKSRVPAALRPAPGDDVLERRTLERYLMVGAVTTLAMAVWLPAYWLREPTRLDNKRAFFLEQAVKEGEDLYQSLCSSCHGEQLEGTPRQITVDGESLQVAEPPLRYVYSRYLAAGRTEDEVNLLLLDAISKGRPGTVMPTWSLAYGGSLNSAQIDNVIEYIRTEQIDFPEAEAEATGAELFAANCALCHGTEADGVGGVGPNLRVAFQRLTRAEVRETIHTGRLNTNRYSMPAWAALGDDALDALVGYLASIQEG
jgi:mono/diheme cytochrome c family protein